MILVGTTAHGQSTETDSLIKQAAYYIFKAGEHQIDFDSASACLAQARSLNKSSRSASITAQILLTESFMLREKGLKTEAIQKVEAAIKILEPGNDKYHLGKALYERSGYYDYMDSIQYTKRVALIEKSVLAFQQARAIKERAEALQMLGDLYHIHFEFDKAIEALSRARGAFDSINHKPLQGIYILLAEIYLLKNDYKQAISCGLSALRTAEICYDSTMQLCQIYSTLSTIYSRIARYELSLQYDKEALKIAIKYDDPSTIAFLLYNISQDYVNLERPQEALDHLSTMPSKFLEYTGSFEKTVISLAYMLPYLAAKQYSKAKYYCDILLKMVDDISISTYVKNDIYRTAAGYYLETKQFQKARFYLIKNLPISKTVGGKETAMDENLLYRVDSAEGNYQSAIRHLLTYKTISDSLFNETKARQFQQLEVEYETAKKTDSLKSKDQVIGLLTQKNNLQQTNLKQSNLIKNITIAGIAIISVALILLYLQFRKNQRSNKIILQKNEELEDMLTEKEWWLKEVHHRVKNNLHTIICLLESQAMYLEKDALQAIEKSQHRIYAMSLIHQKLYQNEDVRSIDMNIYLEEFIGYLKDSFDTQKIEFITEVGHVQLNLQQAIPVALIINEAVTNSIKYAFGNENDSKIYISMAEKDDIVKLRIMDNGRGFEMKVENEGKSLGMQLIKGLSKELKGTVGINTKGGTTLTVEFKRGPLTDEMAYVKNENIVQ